MRSVRRTLSVFLGTLGLLGFMAVAAPARVSATTGPTQFLPPPKYKVQNKVELLYTGQYVLKSAANKARISGGAMGIEIDDNTGALYGVAQFYGYDQSGHQSTWVGTLYNFQQGAKQVMNIDVMAPSSTVVLAKLTVTRSKQGDLGGTIRLPTGTYAISWHKITK